ncbi:MAG: hypothetical protein OEY11_15380 [Gammaproteobacteria bacterium]|nr:hypothetical protein [Gammaproteobacteria bacterium]
MSAFSPSLQAIEVYKENHKHAYIDVFHKIYDSSTLPATATGFDIGFRVIGGTGLTAHLKSFHLYSDDGAFVENDVSQLSYGLGYSYLMKKTPYGKLSLFAERDMNYNLPGSVVCTYECSAETTIGASFVGSRFEFKYSFSNFDDAGSGTNMSIMSSGFGIESSTVGNVKMLSFVLSVTALRAKRKM